MLQVHVAISRRSASKQVVLPIPGGNRRCKPRIFSCTIAREHVFFPLPCSVKVCVILTNYLHFATGRSKLMKWNGSNMSIIILVTVGFSWQEIADWIVHRWRKLLFSNFLVVWCVSCMAWIVFVHSVGIWHLVLFISHRLQRGALYRIDGRTGSRSCRVISCGTWTGQSIPTSGLHFLGVCTNMGDGLCLRCTQVRCFSVCYMHF